jgi:hypothetical protein
LSACDSSNPKSNQYQTKSFDRTFQINQVEQVKFSTWFPCTFHSKNYQTYDLAGKFEARKTLQSDYVGFGAKVNPSH